MLNFFIDAVIDALDAYRNLHLDQDYQNKSLQITYIFQIQLGLRI